MFGTDAAPVPACSMTTARRPSSTSRISAPFRGATSNHASSPHTAREAPTPRITKSGTASVALARKEASRAVTSCRSVCCTSSRRPDLDIEPRARILASSAVEVGEGRLLSASATASATNRLNGVPAIGRTHAGAGLLSQISQLPAVAVPGLPEPPPQCRVSWPMCNSNGPARGAT
eukprot:scaffold759_cov119-Isochrysis_galbana.AAC.7